MNELMNLRDKRVQTWNAAKAFLESHRGTEQRTTPSSTR